MRRYLAYGCDVVGLGPHMYRYLPILVIVYINDVFLCFVTDKVSSTNSGPRAFRICVGC
jgi:hypothetical protein